MARKTIDLKQVLYGELITRIDATPRDVLENALYFDIRLGSQWTDLELATKDYIAQIKKALSPVPAIISDDATTLTIADDANTHVMDLYYKMMDRARHIDIKAIILAHQDDGYVLNPYDKVYTPDMWDVLTNTMDPHIASDLSDQMAPCTCQAFADAYAVRHREQYGEEWEPYKEHPQI